MVFCPTINSLFKSQQAQICLGLRFYPLYVVLSITSTEDSPLVNRTQSFSEHRVPIALIVQTSFRFAPSDFRPQRRVFFFASNDTFAPHETICSIPQIARVNLISQLSPGPIFAGPIAISFFPGCQITQKLQ